MYLPLILGSLKESRIKLDSILLKDFKMRCELPYSEEKIFKTLQKTDISDEVSNKLF